MLLTIAAFPLAIYCGREAVFLGTANNTGVCVCWEGGTSKVMFLVMYILEESS